MTDTQAVDFWSAPDPMSLGAINPWPYTGNAQPDDAWFAACAALHNSPQVTIQEMYSTRSQEGQQAAIFDVQFAEFRARKRGVGIVDYAVSDGNGTDSWDASEYGLWISNTATLRYFFYGSLGVIASAVAGALRGRGAGLLVRGVDGAGGEHVPSTWGNANLVTQVVGPSPIPNTDLNLVHVDLEDNTVAINEQWFNEMYGTIVGAPAFGQKPLAEVIGGKIDAQTAELVAAIKAIPSGGSGGLSDQQKQAITATTTALESATTALKTAFS